MLDFSALVGACTQALWQRRYLRFWTNKLMNLMQSLNSPASLLGLGLRRLCITVMTVIAGLVTMAHAADTPPAAVNTPDTQTAQQSPDYKLGPGDVIQVFVWRNPELSISVPVRPDGKISTPLVDDMVAVGKTPTQLARDMEATLSEYVVTPDRKSVV